MDTESRLRPHTNSTTVSKYHCGVIYAAFAAAAMLAAPAARAAATFTTLYSFPSCQQEPCPDGDGPSGGLIQATNGDLYGTTQGGGGPSSQGTIFRITTSGKLTTLHTFDGADGEYPQQGLIQAANGNFYGTTQEGGTDDGTIFELTPSGNLTTLGNFDQATEEGIDPVGLIQAADGDLVGTTGEGGGTASEPSGGGSVFKITLSGTLTTLYSFVCPTAESCPEGEFPSRLVQATNGDFYGTAYGGGSVFEGTVFKITSSGTLTTLHNFCAANNECPDGVNPTGGLIQAANGDLYGTTSEAGGANGEAFGTVFKITPDGTLTTLYSFCSQGTAPDCPDGAVPGGLIQGSDGNFYGITGQGGANSNATQCASGCGTIFQITPSGTLTTLYNFCSQLNPNGTCTDLGETSGPLGGGGLIQDTNGELYGTSGGSGANGTGAVYSLSVTGLVPFVETQTTVGKPGAKVTILGTDLGGATSVTFNGTKATFTVVSQSEIKTTVPSGATTGTVEVVTPGGTLKTITRFVVKK
jgi:uncharacterized repeat protein (TIGR03803 family)